MDFMGSLGGWSGPEGPGQLGVADPVGVRAGRRVPYPRMGAVLMHGECRPVGLGLVPRARTRHDDRRVVEHPRVAVYACPQLEPVVRAEEAIHDRQEPCAVPQHIQVPRERSEPRARRHRAPRTFRPRRLIADEGGGSLADGEQPPVILGAADDRRRQELVIVAGAGPRPVQPCRPRWPRHAVMAARVVRVVRPVALLLAVDQHKLVGPGVVLQVHVGVEPIARRLGVDRVADPGRLHPLPAVVADRDARVLEVVVGVVEWRMHHPEAPAVPLVARPEIDHRRVHGRAGAVRGRDVEVRRRVVGRLGRDGGASRRG